MSKLAEKEHKKLTEFMFNQAIKFPKKHGSWMRFYLGDRTFLIMDSWNKKISVVLSIEPVDFRGQN